MALPQNRTQSFFINGNWVAPRSSAKGAVINPATEEVLAEIALGGAEDVDAAVAAAQAGFDLYSRWPVHERAALLSRIAMGMQARLQDLAEAISAEMGAPMWLATYAQAPSGLAHIQTMIEVLKSFEFEREIAGARILREPIGVCGLITPWNWPLNQIACKLAPALAAGCAVILKPSELAPLNALILAEILEEAGCPPGVFNLVNGDGPNVGAALAAHPHIAMMSFTGSTRAGVAVAKASADTVKRVAQELGGKSANILLADCDLEKAVRQGAGAMFVNSGQSCNAPSRMLVPRGLHDRALEIAAETARNTPVADPKSAPRGAIGPLANAAQFAKVNSMIEEGVREGAILAAGGPGRPEGFERGYFVRPTVFGGANNGMRIAREEIFGPVLTILPYDSEAEAVAIANDTPFGLSGYVQSGDPDRARAIARQLRTGNVHINGAGLSYQAPFGGYKQSGNGREWGAFGLEEFLETKAVMGWGEAA